MPHFRVNARWAKLSKITDHLYIGGVVAVVPHLIEEYKISCIINATTEVPNLRMEGLANLKLWLADTPETDISFYFDLVADQIQAIQDQEGRTLLHCLAGVSRSASFCLAFLMKYEKKTLREAYEYLAARRPVVRPNIGFWKQLIQYEKELYGKTSVNILHVKGTKEHNHDVPDVYIVEEDEDLESLDSISVASNQSQEILSDSEIL